MIKRHTLIILIIFIGIFLRLFTISNQSIIFWYDQARDFARVEEIIDGNIKIQGPSASGTNDTIYHGVFYYYYILPWVWLGGGNPVFVSNALVVFGGLSLAIFYLFSRKIFSSQKVSTLAVLFLSLSYLHSQMSTWLSNPQTLIFSLPLFYYCFWLVFFSKKSLVAVLGLAVGLSLSIHAGIFEVHLLVPLFLAYLREAYLRKTFFWWKNNEYLGFLVVFLVILSPMIMTQYFLYRGGILDLSNLQTQSSSSINIASSLLNGLKLYWQYATQALTPFWPYLSILFVYPVYIGWRHLTTEIKICIGLLFTSPLFLLLIQQRNSTHLLVGVEMLIYMVLALGITLIWKKSNLQKYLAVFLIALFIISNGLNHLESYSSKRPIFAIQKGALLNDQLALLDYTYQRAAGDNFTFSSSTNPYAINITWGYLYKTYGAARYGYLPTFVGPDQIGLVGSDFLLRSEKPTGLHFTIFEPDTGLNDKMTSIFIGEQDYYSTLTEEINFGSLILQVRQAK